MNRNRNSMQSIPFLAERLVHDTEGVGRLINFIKVGDPAL
jgi:hypothetical protein